MYPNSHKLAEYIINSRFCENSKLKVLGHGSSNGIDVDYFKKDQTLHESAILLQHKLNIANNDYVFLFIGRLVKDKGIEELVLAFTELEKKI